MTKDPLDPYKALIDFNSALKSATSDPFRQLRDAVKSVQMIEPDIYRKIGLQDRLLKDISAPFTEFDKAIRGLADPFAHLQKQLLGLSRTQTPLAAMQDRFIKMVDPLADISKTQNMFDAIFKAELLNLNYTAGIFDKSTKHLERALNQNIMDALSAIQESSMSLVERGVLVDLATEINEVSSNDSTNHDAIVAALARSLEILIAYVKNLSREAFQLNNLIALVVLYYTLRAAYQPDPHEVLDARLEEFTTVIEQRISEINAGPIRYRSITSVHLRMEADKNSASLMIIEAGASMELIESHGEWLMVTVSDSSGATKTGFVYAKYLERLPDIADHDIQ